MDFCENVRYGLDHGCEDRNGEVDGRHRATGLNDAVHPIEPLTVPMVPLTATTIKKKDPLSEYLLSSDWESEKCSSSSQRSQWSRVRRCDSHCVSHVKRARVSEGVEKPIQHF